MRRSYLSSVIYGSAAAIAMGAFAGAANAAILVGNTGVSGNLTAVSGNESGSFSFDNDGEFLLVTVAGETGGNVGATSVNTANISVTFNGDALTLVGFGVNSNDGFAGIWYLKDPDLGNHSLSFNFNQDVITGDASTESNWQFGAIALSNVDEADPIAGTYGLGVSTSAQSFVITPDVSQTFDAGDFVALADSNQAVTTVGAHFRTATDGQSTLYSLAQGNAYASIHQVLTAGDIDINGDVPMTDINNGNKYHARGVVLNAIPEPASLGVLGFGALLLTRRRR